MRRAYRRSYAICANILRAARNIPPETCPNRVDPYKGLISTPATERACLELCVRVDDGDCQWDIDAFGATADSDRAGWPSIAGTLLAVEPFDERDLVTLIVVPHLVDHSLADEESETSSPQPQFFAYVKMAEGVVGQGRVR